MMATKGDLMADLMTSGYPFYLQSLFIPKSTCLAFT